MTIAEGDGPIAVKLIDSTSVRFGVYVWMAQSFNNKRRFRRRYKSMARQNGKTFENGIMGTYIAGFGDITTENYLQLRPRKDKRVLLGRK